MTHDEAARLLNLNIGDKVTLTRKVQFDEGWTGGWVQGMDNFIGKTGIITSNVQGNEGVHIDFGDRHMSRIFWPVNGLIKGEAVSSHSFGPLGVRKKKKHGNTTY